MAVPELQLQFLIVTVSEVAADAAHEFVVVDRGAHERSFDGMCGRRRNTRYSHGSRREV
jgi:hypothetical protein